MEPETDQAWTSGKYAFMRNWTVRVRGRSDRRQQGQGQVRGRPAPELRGRRQGRHPRRPQQRDLGLHEEPGAVAEVLRLRRLARVAEDLAATSTRNAAILNATYDDPDVKKAVPYAAELKAALGQAKARPVSPVYPQISQAIYKNVNDALAGRTSVRRTRSRRPATRSTRRCRPSDLMEAASIAGRRTTPSGGAPRESRSAAWRSLMVAPSMILIAIVAAWPIIYAHLAVPARVQRESRGALTLVGRGSATTRTR